MPNAPCPMPHALCPMPYAPIFKLGTKIPELLDTMVGILLLVDLHVCFA